MYSEIGLIETITELSVNIFFLLQQRIAKWNNNLIFFPSGNGEDIFVHISDIDSDYVPRKGDRVRYYIRYR